MELGSTGNYFRGAGDQSHSFVDREPYQIENFKFEKYHLKGKTAIFLVLFFLKKLASLASGGFCTPDPPCQM